MNVLEMEPQIEELQGSNQGHFVGKRESLLSPTSSLEPDQNEVKNQATFAHEVGARK